MEADAAKQRAAKELEDVVAARAVVEYCEQELDLARSEKQRKKAEGALDAAICALRKEEAEAEAAARDAEREQAEADEARETFLREEREAAGALAKLEADHPQDEWANADAVQEHLIREQAEAPEAAARALGEQQDVEVDTRVLQEAEAWLADVTQAEDANRANEQIKAKRAVAVARRNLQREQAEATFAAEEAEREEAEAEALAQVQHEAAESQIQLTGRLIEEQKQADAAAVQQAEAALQQSELLRQKLQAAQVLEMHADRELSEAQQRVAEAEATEGLRRSTDGVYVGLLNSTARIKQVTERRFSPSQLRHEMSAAAQVEIGKLKEKVTLWIQETCERQRARELATSRWKSAVTAAQELQRGPLFAATRRLVLVVAEGDRGVATSVAVALIQRGLHNDELVRAVKKGRKHIPEQLEQVEKDYREGLQLLGLAVSCNHVSPLEAEPRIRMQLDPSGQVRVQDVKTRAAQLHVAVLRLRAEEAAQAATTLEAIAHSKTRAVIKAEKALQEAQISLPAKVAACEATLRAARAEEKEANELATDQRLRAEVAKAECSHAVAELEAEEARLAAEKAERKAADVDHARKALVAAQAKLNSASAEERGVAQTTVRDAAALLKRTEQEAEEAARVAEKEFAEAEQAQKTDCEAIPFVTQLR